MGTFKFFEEDKNKKNIKSTLKNFFRPVNWLDI